MKKQYDDFTQLKIKDLSKSTSNMTYKYISPETGTPTKVPSLHYEKILNQVTDRYMADITSRQFLTIMHNQLSTLKKEDEKYIYLVITCTNADLTATQIIRYYEMRPEIEEDFRQLKYIWKICTFTSTKYVFVMCQICITFLAYNLFNIFKTSDEGIKYLYKSMKKISN